MQTEVLGIKFHQTTLSQAVETGRGWLLESGFHMVVTPNPEFILQAQKDESFRHCLNEADLVLPDGIGVIYASRILGTPLPCRVPGIEFATGLLSEMASVGARLFLLGAQEGVADEAGRRLMAQFPGLVICGTQHGYFGSEDQAAVALYIQQTQPDVLFVCLGAPRQEMFLRRWGSQTGAKIGVGLGGCLDVFAGRVDRAPEFWIKCNLEWLYRLCKEPKRLGRMAKLPLVLWQALVKRVMG